MGKGVHQGCVLSSCLFNLYAKYIIQNARLEEAQAGIKIAGRNINNLRYADDTTLMAESEELKSLLIKVKEESEKVGKAQHSENKDHGIWSHHFTAKNGETMETVRDFSPYEPSQCTSPKHSASCIEPGPAAHFIHDIIRVSMP